MKNEVKPLKREGAFGRSKQERIRKKKYARFMQTNYDWDYSYVLDLLRFKLRMTREYIQKNSLCEKEAVAEKIRKIAETEAYLEKIVGDNYLFALIDDFNIRYGKVKHCFEKIENSSNSRFATDWSDVAPEKLEEAKAVYATLHEKAEHQRKDDLRKAFDIMCEQIWDWWD